MHRKLLAGGGLIIILLLAVSGYFVLRKPLTPIYPSANPTAQPTSIVPKTSLRALLAYTGNQTCEFTDSGSHSQGRVYVSGGKVRSDFTVSLSGTTSNFHMYTDGKNIYAWMSGEKQGFQTTVKSLNVVSPSGSPSGGENIDLDRQLDYRCRTETVDNSFFTLPLGVTFSDISLLVTPSASPAIDKTTQCASCNQLPADSAAQCRSSLGC